MAEYKIALEKRVVSGKKLKDLRAKGLVPGVVYGGDKAPTMVQSEYIATEKTLRGAGYHSAIDATIDGKKQLVMVKNVDIDPVKRLLRNIEFLAISANEVVEATTPIVLVGYEKSEAHVKKLNLLQTLEEIEIEAKPADLPKNLEVDASGLVNADSRLTLADIVLPNGVAFADREMDAAEIIVASVYDSAADAAAQEAADEAAAEVSAADVPSESGTKAEEAKTE
jgi:large subunit ribosomal protein L25